jgi:hypothetical protein
MTMIIEPYPTSSQAADHHERVPWTHPVFASLDHPLFRKRERGLVPFLPPFRQRRREGRLAQRSRGELSPQKPSIA